jgi:diguanylate cyclase (GGDEF)-like protein
MQVPFMISMPQPENDLKAIEDMNIPGSPIPLNSKFYIDRPPSEALAYKELCKAGSLIRIRAPRHMGKSSLMLRLINQAESLCYQVVKIDFQQADTAIFESIDKLLRWLCINVARQLKLPLNLDDCWNTNIGSKVSCTICFEEYLLWQIDTPLVLVLNEVNRLFEYPEIAQDFFPLLRSWHEEARLVPLWQSLRLVLVHSTEVYVSLSINQSPFNVGLTLKLPEFTSLQAQDLAQRHGLKLNDSQINKLNNMVGGHPYLLHLAFYHLYHAQGTLEELLQEAPTQTGVYREHLQNLWVILNKKPELLAALKEIILGSSSVQLPPLIAYQLDSMGLIKFEGNNCLIFCELYRLYFAQYDSMKKPDQRPNLHLINLQELEQENQKLQSLIKLDTLTKVANFSHFSHSLEIEWEKMAKSAEPISLILCNIDYFKIYNDIYGHQEGDNCLKQVAAAICQIVKEPGNLVARYWGEDFIILLSGIDATAAFKISEQVRLKVKQIARPFKSREFGGLPNSIVTISLGVACTIPTFSSQAKDLLLEAEKALYKAKRQGRNCTTLSSVLNFKL